MSEPYGTAKLSIHYHASRSTRGYAAELPVSKDSSEDNSTSPHYTDSEGGATQEGEDRLGDQNNSIPTSLLFCNLPGLSTYSLDYSTYSFGDLTHSGTSTYFLLQCSGPFARSIELQVGSLSHSLLGLISDGSELLPSTFPFVEV